MRQFLKMKKAKRAAAALPISFRLSPEIVAFSVAQAPPGTKSSNKSPKRDSLESFNEEKRKRKKTTLMRWSWEIVRILTWPTPTKGSTLIGLGVSHQPVCESGSALRLNIARILRASPLIERREDSSQTPQIVMISTLKVNSALKD